MDSKEHVDDKERVISIEAVPHRGGHRLDSINDVYHLHMAVDVENKDEGKCSCRAEGTPQRV